MTRLSNEIQIEIDDVYGCPGHCPGCVLSSIERKNILPDMDTNVLKTSISKLIDYIPTLEGLEKINLTYGIADHFLMTEEYLNFTYHEGAKLIKAANLTDKKSGIFYSASMIGKHDKIMSKVNFLYEISKKEGVPVYVLAVLDPKNLYRNNFSKTYTDNIIKTNELLGRVDLSINLSIEAINMISPEDLYEFAKLNKFDEVTINWVPTKDNIKHSYIEQETLSKWLIRFDDLIASDELIGTSYRPVMLRTINNINCFDYENERSLIDCIDSNLDELVNKSIQIDHLGNLFPKFEAIGDIGHNPRIGIKQSGNILEKNSIKEMLHNNRNNTKKFIIETLSNKTCINCNLNKYCAISGFHAYNHILNNIEEPIMKSNIKRQSSINKCFHVGKKMLEHYMNIANNQDPENIEKH